MKWLLLVALLAVPSVGLSGECSTGCASGFGICAPRVKAGVTNVVKAPVKLVRCLLGK